MVYRLFVLLFASLSAIIIGCDDTDDNGDQDTDTSTDRDTEDGAFACYGEAGSPLNNGALPDGYCAWEWASDLGEPRAVTVDKDGDVLVLDREEGRVLLLHDDDGDGVSGEDERIALASAPELNHGIALNGGRLYASSSTTVYGWDYPGDREPLGDPSEVISGMPEGGQHYARTLVFDLEGNLFVNIGSEDNVDDDPSRARVVRFTAEQVENGADYSEAEVWGNGTRNENALAIDSEGRLWGAENGSDNLSREDLGGDIHTDNPGEELNLFDQPGAFYGYPYCWSEGALEEGSMGPGTQWAYDPSSEYTDEWCRDDDNVVPPEMVLQAHTAPLGMRFYQGDLLPDDVVGDLFIALHGSWNRDPAVGYKVVRVPFEDDTPEESVDAILEFDGDGNTGSGWPYRFVDLAIGAKGQLFVTSDANGTVVVIGYEDE